jgi:outer membrane assembly lipoprotein YfiO
MTLSGLCSGKACPFTGFRQWVGPSRPGTPLIQGRGLATLLGLRADPLDPGPRVSRNSRERVRVASTLPDRSSETGDMTRRSWDRGPGSNLRLGRIGGLLAALGLLWLSACASTNPYLGLSGDELWDSGFAAYEDGDWEDAITAFQLLLSQSPGHPRTAEARIFTARAHVERQEYITAAAEFERFLELHFNHGLAPEASLELCRAYAELAPIPQRDQTYTRRARDACLQTEQEFRGLSVAQEAEEIHLRMVDELAERAYQNARFYQRRGPPQLGDPELRGGGRPVPGHGVGSAGDPGDVSLLPGARLGRRGRGDRHPAVRPLPGFRSDPRAPGGAGGWGWDPPLPRGVRGPRDHGS